MEDEDFDESMRKVNLIGGIVKDIASKDDCKSRLGMIRAEELLGNYDKTWDESSLKTVQNAGFMAYVERDAKQRADAKKKEIKQSDYFKTMGNHEYRNKNFEKALIYYNQAIDVRKDSCVLYTNRALTKINLGLLDEAVADCDKALRINERSLNALLYKAEALNGLGDMAVAKQVLADALNTYPDKTQRIQDYRKKLNL
ncbi:tetratricopeptide repeat protein 12-like isoform X2 [Daktulosphaira vitifoliae]|uniref:tetratricopeptide repeat protein 12-like isoform X2 n=1 Tax=Daktulosphaira vitifoliae TaxID=58002 RepID=UPI0021A9F676|nr:tetratricopeptide repeat protein 12-like isoform X2 [Daktulosphaira vitifoliae]